MYWWLRRELGDTDAVRNVVSLWYVAHTRDRPRIELLRCVVCLLRGSVRGGVIEAGPPFRGLALSVEYPHGWANLTLEIVRRVAPPDTYTLDFSIKDNRVVVMNQIREWLGQCPLSGTQFSVGCTQRWLQDLLFIHPCVIKRDKL